MQPTCRHVPPRYGSFSTSIVFRPNSPARIAATYPPGPLPIIATSYFATRSLPSAGARTGERSCLLTAVTLDKSSRGFRPIRQVASLPLCGSLFKTHKKPPTLTAQTAASSKHQILTVACPPRNLGPHAVEACFLLARTPQPGHGGEDGAKNPYVPAPRKPSPASI